MQKILCGIFILTLISFSPVWGQDNTNAGGNTGGNPGGNSSANSTANAGTDDQGPVSRQEFNELKKDNAEMKQELADIKKTQTDQQTNADQDAEDYEKALKSMQDQIQKAQPGLESVVIAGDAAFGFQAVHGSPTTFSADVSPLILWQPADPRILVETAFDLGIGGEDINSETSTLTVNLADISYELCDYCMVGGGLFAVPFGQYHNHFDPPWINKFPDDPLAFDTLAPESEVGFFAKGAIPSGTTTWTYDIYAANGPNLITDDPNAAGQLDFDDFTDLNNNKAVGGRIGFLPIPEIETGYSVQFSQPNPSGFQNVEAYLQAADFHYKPLIKPLGGTFDLASEWIWSDLGTQTYDPTGTLGFGPDRFVNYRSGGYVSLCYRPTESDNKVLSSFEFVSRYDELQSPINSPGGNHEERVTLGIDYWLTPYCVLKSAYEIDQKQVGENNNAFILQVGIGL
jgi:hypothetical protein